MDLNNPLIGGAAGQLAGQSPDQSSAWDALKGLVAKLNTEVSVSVQSFRAQQWYVLKDNETGESFRVSDSLSVILDAKYRGMTIGAALALTDPHADAQMKEQVALALVQLYRSYLLDFSPQDQLPDQVRQLRAPQKSLRKRFNPLSIRLPLLDPDDLLLKLKPLSDKLFHPLCVLVILLFSVAGLAIGLANASSIGSDVLSQIETPAHWWLFVVAYLMLKIVHETAHGMAVKRWGGHVHDVGVMLLVFFPVPYVDASASNAFAEKYHRIGVAAAGIVAEAFCAAVAVFVWLSVEPGIVRTLAFDVILIGGVSTLLFNGNPLMRFDAYYVLADFLEIPNLFTRSRKYVDYFLIRYGLGDSAAVPNTRSKSEAAWLLGYGVSSSIYRLGIMVGIATYLVDTFFFVGVALAVWIVFAQLALPLWRFAVQLRRTDTQSQRRVSLLLRFALILIFVGAVMAFMPLPQTTVAQGIVTVEDDAHIRSGADGFVVESIFRAGEDLDKGVKVAQLSNPELERNLLVTRATISAIKAELDAARSNGVEVGIINETLHAHQRQLAEIETRVANLTLVSKKQGALVSATAKPIVDRYVKRGETIGYVVDPEHLIVRVVVREKDLDLVQSDMRSVSLFVTSGLGSSHRAEVLRVVPSALREIPSRALGTDAGGDIAVDPTDETGLRPVENVFQADIKTMTPLVDTNVATRVYARFVHAPEPLLPRAVRAARRLFLSKFST